jgi:hypothetical protein
MLQIMTILKILLNKSMMRFFHKEGLINCLQSFIISLLILTPVLSEARYVVLANARTDENLPAYFSKQFLRLDDSLKDNGWNVGIYGNIGGKELRRVMQDPRVEAIFLSSHANPDYLLVENYTVTADQIKTNKRMKYVFFCGCHTAYLTGWRRVFPNAIIVGMTSYVYPNECINQLFGQFWNAVQDL